LSHRDRDAPIFLVGFMGAGKTSVGRVLAARRGWDFEDTDALVVEAAGLPIDAIFRTRGEGRFRELEWDVLRTLGHRKRIVVATGGGLFLGVAQRGFVRAHGISCWLDAPLDVIAARLADGSSRPLWTDDDPLSRRTFFERRRAAYALAAIRVDASSGVPDEVALRVETAWRAVLR
jgi:shikimate kinase